VKKYRQIIFRALVLLACIACACSRGTFIEEGGDRPLHTPAWAFEPWISKDISDRDDTYAFVQGFIDRDIPVGVVVIDSPWETNYNTFVPNPSRYPEFAKMVSDLHSKNIRIVLWITQMINFSSYDLESGGDKYIGPSPNYFEAKNRGFLVNNGELYSWWKGSGGGLDFFNPEALAWWHRQQDPLFKIGINGWKVDFGDSYITTDIVQTAIEAVPHQKYSEEYYRDFYNYGSFKRGKDEFVTMVRPWDESYEFPGRFFARPEHAPVAWVGDNRRDWIGLADALDHIFRSARAGYIVVGSDIGGYLDRDDKNLLGPEIPFSQEVFARWTAVGALTPFMQLHGRANITPWTVPERVEETVELYRYWSKLHHELVPFFYSLAEEAHINGKSIIEPQGEPADWPGDYRFLVGNAFLVAPITDSTGIREVELPSGSRWYDWWDPSAIPLEGGQTITSDFSFNRKKIPLFVREGAIIPMNVSDSVTGLGTAASKGYLTLLVYPGPSLENFYVHEDDRVIMQVEARAREYDSPILLSSVPRPLILRVRTPAKTISTVLLNIGEIALPKLPDRDAFDKAETGWFAETPTLTTWIKLPAANEGRSIHIIY